MEEKIRKLMALAEHPNTSPEEASAAAGMAAKLMMKYNISEDVLKTAGEKAEAISESDVALRASATDRPAAMHLFPAIASLYGMRTYIRWTGKVNEFWFVGRKSHHELGKRWVDYLWRSADLAVKEWKKSNKRSTNMEAYRAERDFKLAFCLAVARRLGEKLAEMKREGVDEPGEKKPGSALMVVNWLEQEQQMTTAYMERRKALAPKGLIKESKLGKPRGFDGDAAQAGRAAGSKIGLHDQIG